jgi:hypothetical protein
MHRFDAYGSSIEQRPCAIRPGTAPPTDDTSSTGRGRPIGLGADLSVTTAVPATEMSSVAAVAPARVVATPPTDLHHSLRRLADGSRPPTPRGSLLPFGRGDVATPIRPITGRPWLSPRSSTRSPIGSSYDALSLAGGLRAYHVPQVEHVGGLGRVSAPVVRHLRRGSSEPPDLTTCRFGPSLSASLACPW